MSIDIESAEEQMNQTYSWHIISFKRYISFLYIRLEEEGSNDKKEGLLEYRKKRY
jgi:hypothetical protein